MSSPVRDLPVSTVVRDLLVRSGLRISWLLLAAAVSFAAAGAGAGQDEKTNLTRVREREDAKIEIGRLLVSCYDGSRESACEFRSKESACDFRNKEIGL